MVDRWLNRLDIVDNIIVNNRNKRRVYNFDYQKYDEEQFWSRYRLTKVEFQDMRPHNDRRRPILADVQLLLILRFYATGTFQLACGYLCQISQPSASRIIKRQSVIVSFTSKDILLLCY